MALNCRMRPDLQVSEEYARKTKIPHSRFVIDLRKLSIDIK